MKRDRPDNPRNKHNFVLYFILAVLFGLFYGFLRNHFYWR